MHEKNQERADWARNAVDTFGIETYGGRTFTDEMAEAPHDADLTNCDGYTMIQDLIGDLLHLAVRHKWDPAEIVRKAVANFDYENAPGYQGD